MAEKQGAHLAKMRANIAARYGLENPDELQAKRLELQALRDSGLLVSVHCYGIQMFSGTASWAELGIPKKDPRRKILTRGRRDLVPQETVNALRNLERRRRYQLEKFGYAVAIWPQFKWLCTTRPEADELSNYEKWKEADGAIQNELEGLREVILENLDSWRDERLPRVFGEIADRAYRQLSALKGTPKKRNSAGKLVTQSKASFRREVILAAQSMLPTLEEVRDDLRFWHSYGFLANPVDVQTEYEEVAHIQAEERGKRQAIRAKYQAEEAEQNSRRTIAEAQAREALVHERAIREEAGRYHEQQLQEMGSPLQGVVDQVEGRLHSSMIRMAENIQKHGHVHSKTAEMARNAIEMYRTLRGLQGDRLFDELVSLEEALKTPDLSGRKADPDRVAAAVTAIAIETEEAARRVTRSVGGSRASFAML